jgi:eukaryotic-like serine/threonine-protein kinase
MSAGASRRLLTRAGWLGMSTDEESRAYLQERLVLLSRLLFWSFAALLVGMVLLYRAYPKIEPIENRTIYETALVGLAVLGIIWRGLLERREVGLQALHAIDLFYGITAGATFGWAAYLASELHMTALANILWTTFVVFLRVIVVPSTGKRTAIVATATFVPIAISAIAIAVTTTTEIPGRAFVGSAVLIGVVLVLLATTGSRIIYGLRRKASSAMRLGSYTLGNKIGEGGHGAVYRANHVLLRRPTAIKLMRPDRIDAVTLDRFEREVQHMSQLTHPNTVAVYDYGRSPDGLFYYAMEYLDGIDLEKLVTTYGAQPGDRVAHILAQVCGALEEAHRRGIVHRDIKPGNIILCERGDVPDVAKVVDFGLVKELGHAGGERTGILGTPAYIAPELVTDPDSTGPATDLYALGAVGYFLLSGRRVFEGKTAVDVCIQHVTQPPIPPSMLALHVSAALEEVILRCLAKRPGDRPQSAAVLARLLRSLPASNDWSEDEAQRWWSDFRRLEEPQSSTPTLTITVDLAQRDAA